MSQTFLKTADEYIADGYTPMMAQYHSIKTEHPNCLLFYRMGDFYELFYEDAIQASRILDITLTKRGKNQGDDIPMCGVPHHSCEPYIAKLIHAGHRVAICEQSETPAEAKARAKKEGKPAAKALVHRQVIRVITQGTLTEDSLLNARENNYLGAICEISGTFGLAWLELSTGEFNVQPTNQQNLITTLERIDIRELLISSKLQNNESLKKFFMHYNGQISEQPSSFFDSQNAQKKLEKVFDVGSLHSFGDFSRAEISAAGALIDYADRTQKGNLPCLSRPHQITDQSIMEIDAATRRNLELTRTLSGETKGSLIDTIDHTITAAGARLLQRRLSSPLTNIQSIHQRQNEVQNFIDHPHIKESIREILKTTTDMQRSLARLSIKRGSPRDLGNIRDGLKSAQNITTILQQDPNENLVVIVKKLIQNINIQKLSDLLNTALEPTLPLLDRDGGFITHGYNSQLDSFRSMRDESKRYIANLQNEYREISSVDSLKISYNNILGYFIDVPAKKADALMVQKKDQSNPFVHRQTLANSVRFTTPELSELERDISNAGEKALAIEQNLFREFADKIINLSSEISTIADGIAALDVAASMAELSSTMNYTRPKVDNSLSFYIKKGRHPVVEKSLQKDNSGFVPNNCNLNNEQKLWLLTGPNMAGKSTFLRQNALIAILAQIGSFVPAESAHIGIVDRCFSRVGASDDLARGQSTFMVEMVETAAILNQAQKRSLVILDEIGRGTATFDGLSIAWACVEHLHEINKCRALFATHYHELTSLKSKLNSLSCHSMQVKEWKNDVVFMHTVTQGSADRSYGIHVARLAGLPQSVIHRAEIILDLLNKGEQSGILAKLADDLPLFTNTQLKQQNSLSAIEEYFTKINPDELSPREALDIIYTAKNLLKNAE